jgi:hypothetical protein
MPDRLFIGRLEILSVQQLARPAALVNFGSIPQLPKRMYSRKAGQRRIRRTTSTQPSCEMGQISRAECPCDPEPVILISYIRLVVMVIVRARFEGRRVPTAAAGGPTRAISCGPSRTVSSSYTAAALAFAILDPLIGVAGHVVETEHIGLERSDRDGSDWDRCLRPDADRACIGAVTAKSVVL